MNKLIVRKGYTFTVRSCEDHNNSDQVASETYDTLEEAELYFNAIQFCQDNDIENQPEFLTNEKEDKLIAYVKSIKELNSNVSKTYRKEKDDYKEFIQYNILKFYGWRENFATGVVDEKYITYSPEDIFVQIIK